MSWLRKLLGLNSKPGDLRETAQNRALSKKPPLILLTSDFGGLTALRIHRFEDAEAACEYIDLWHPQRAGSAVFPFWALPAEPSEEWRADRDEYGESVVLIRDDEREGVVYPFSFADLPTAWMFVRQEITSGLEFDKISIYWAVPVEIVLDDEDRARIRPDTPPPISSTITIPDMPDLVIETKTTIVRRERSEEPATRPNGHNGDDDGRPPFPVVQYSVERGSKSAAELRTNGESTADVARRVAEDTNGGISHGEPRKSGETSTNGERADEKSGEGDVQPPKGENETPHDPTKIQRWRRLDRRDGPFKGFGSPRGRF